MGKSAQKSPPGQCPQNPPVFIQQESPTHSCRVARPTKFFLRESASCLYCSGLCVSLGPSPCPYPGLTVLKRFTAWVSRGRCGHKMARLRQLFVAAEAKNPGTVASPLAATVVIAILRCDFCAAEFGQRRRYSGCSTLLAIRHGGVLQEVLGKVVPVMRCHKMRFHVATLCKTF